MTVPAFNDLPDVDSELFEHVTDDELALLDCYRALRPGERAVVLEALVRMTEPSRHAPRPVAASRPAT
jgi:ubiquinone/menaquinone biosynthesis C-methylase UbiE